MFLPIVVILSTAFSLFINAGGTYKAACSPTKVSTSIAHDTSKPHLKAQLGHVHTLRTRADYVLHFEGNIPLITFYTGTHCGPCKRMRPAYESLAKDFTKIQFCVVDISNPAFKKNMQDLSIRSVPTLVFSHKGKVVRKEVGGVSKTEMEQWIKDFGKQISTNPKQIPAKKTPPVTKTP